MQLSNYIYLFLFTLLLVSCQSKQSIQIKDALEYAGANRNEMEKVILHYSKNPEDSLKLDAAKFLIKNMPGLFSVDPKSFEGQIPFFTEISKLTNDTTIEFWVKHAKVIAKVDSCLDAGFSIPVIRPDYQEDIKTMSSQDIISIIDNAFYGWQTYPWSKAVSYNNFLEYILPYRINETKTENFHQIFRSKYLHLLDTITSTSIEQPAQILANNIERYFLLSHVIFNKAPFLASTSFENLLLRNAGSCLDETLINVLSFRTWGIPIAYDFIPVWANRGRLSHHWSKVIKPNDNRNLIHNINNRDTLTGGIISSSTLTHLLQDSLKIPKDFYVQHQLKISKIYRNMYSMQNRYFPKDVYDKYNSWGFLVSNRIKDVTSEYLDCADLKIKVNSNAKYAALCSFCPSEWTPVALGEVSKKKMAVFNNVGKNIVYIVMTMKGNNLHPISEPFIVLNDKSVKYLTPDLSARQDIFLKRKYPIAAGTLSHASHMCGGRFEVSNNANFHNPVLLHEVDSVPLSIIDIPLNLSERYRYIRYVFPDHIVKCIAELRCYCEKSGELSKISGTPFGNTGALNFESLKAFDNNWDSYCEMNIKEELNWIALDFGKSYKLKQLTFAPRSDTNYIIPGNLYELLYWHNGNWVSLGTKTASSSILKYQDVPEEALFLLKCLSGGIEERIFTYEDGKQVWW